MKKTLFTIALATTAATSLSYGAALASFFEDFEALDASSPSALSGTGWKIFGNAFDSGGNYQYGYGVFGAPNGNTDGGGFRFSAVGSGEGGPDQGAQQLRIFGDYNNGDQAAGGNNFTIEANTFQEQTIVPGEGGLYTFQFDAKAGDLAGASTALAFIKVLDPNDGFSLSEFVTVDTTALPTTWGTYSMDIDVNGLGGQILQFGFLANTNDFEPSTVIYDNISFTPEPTSAMLLGLSGLVLLRRRRR